MRELLKAMGRVQIRRKEFTEVVSKELGISMAQAYRRVQQLLSKRIIYTDGRYLYCEPIKIEMIRSW